jgi:2-hydroxychromene-2-carboxylate isomerase
MRLTYSFDPNCPWTWLTSRWLVKTAALDGHTIVWRSLSLAHVNRGQELPERFRDLVAAGVLAHRVIQALDRLGDQDGIGRFYEAYGTRTHRKGEAASRETVVAAAEDAGLGAAVIAAMDDATLDEAVGAVTDEAVAAAGGDVGSPVLRIGDGPSYFGPIIDEVPDDEGSLRLFRAVTELAAVPQFFELKRGRVRGPQTTTS